MSKERMKELRMFIKTITIARKELLKEQRVYRSELFELKQEKS